MGRNSVHKIKRAPRYSQTASVVHLEDDADLFALLQRTPNPLLLLLEGVQDPHNLGACLRTASGAGVTAVIAPTKGACGLTHTVRDVSCGGADEVPFLQVKNINMLLRALHERDIQIIGTSDRGGVSLYQTDLSGPTCLVLGSEGWGLRKVTGDHCDHLVNIPMAGKVDCLNVSVSAGICLYEAVRQRL